MGKNEIDDIINTANENSMKFYNAVSNISKAYIRKKIYNANINEIDDIITNCITDLYLYSLPKYKQSRGTKSAFCRKCLYNYVIKHGIRFQKQKKRDEKVLRWLGGK